MIAIITDNVPGAVHKLLQEKVLLDYDREKRKGVFTSGREFIVVDNEARLQGVTLTDYIMLGYPSDALLAVAKSRMQV